MKDAQAGFPSVTLDETSQKIVVSNNGSSGNVGGYSSEGASNDLQNQKVLPARTLEDLYFGNVDFSGKTISFHVIDAPIKQVLHFISEETGLNTVIDEKVTGTVTLKLENIPWDQALYTIFQVKGLGYTRQGNVITISTLADIEERTKKLKEISAQQNSIKPLVTKNIVLNYAKASEMKTRIEEVLGQATQATQAAQSTGGEQGSSQTAHSSSTGSSPVVAHEESNTLIVTASKEDMEKIEQVVSYLDKPPQQVMVEAKIVEASENFTKNFGVNWDVFNNLPVTINTSSILNIFQGITGSYDVARNADQGNLNFRLNGIPFVGDINATLNIAETEGYVKIVSTPKVVTVSGKEASITRNSPILIPGTATVTPDGNSTTTSQTSDVAVSLSVTPTITSAGGIFLDVEINRSDAGGAGGAFQTNRNAKTQVLIPNGHTIVIGGIYEEEETSRIDAIPFLKKIPFLNLLAKSSGVNTSKTELLVFVTPKLLNINK